MWQLAAPSVRPPHHPIRQRPSARVVGLDGRAKLVSGPRKRERSVEEHEWRRFGAGGGHEGEEQKEED
jgi:hypothetical protein